MAQTEQALHRHEGAVIDFTAEAAIVGGEVRQLPDGRASVIPGDVESGKLAGGAVCGVFRLKLTDNIAILNGGRVYWDHSANKAHYKKVSDRDFYLGRAVADTVAGTDKTVDVALNIDPPYDIDIMRDACLTVPTGTQALGGFGEPKVRGGALSLELTSTNEAQCVDLLSVDRFSVAANAIVEAIFRPAVNGSTSAVDFNIGVATGTSTTDADATTENVFAHIDGGALTILAQSDDNVAPVTAVDTTKVITAGDAVANRTEVWFDLRNPADVQIYVDGVNVLPSSVFAVATGPLALLAHLEKTSSAATGRFIIDALRARFMEN
jgi:predicted RecA/RadA family phage recombinase